MPDLHVWHSFATCIPALEDVIRCTGNISVGNRVNAQYSIKNMEFVMQGVNC